MKHKSFKRKYEQKLFRRALGVEGNRAFLLAHMKKEWNAIEHVIENDRRKRNLYDIAQQTGAALGFTILGMAAVCGVLFVGAVAPNVFSAFGRLGRHRRYFHKNDFAERVRYFRRRGYVNVVKDDEGKMEIQLTALGEEQMIKRALGELRIAPQKRWDGIWRVVLFDIPERHRWARVGMRDALKRMGFYRLQKSTFVFPYPCMEEVEFLHKLYDVGHAIRFMETASLGFDDDVKDFFSLR